MWIIFNSSLSTSVCIKTKNASVSLAKSYERHGDGTPGSEHASAAIWSGRCCVGYEHQGRPAPSGPALACRMCTSTKIPNYFTCSWIVSSSHDSPVEGSSMTSVIEQLEGRKVSVHAAFEPQRPVPQVVPSPLIQEHHLGHNAGSNCYRRSDLTLICRCEVCGRSFGATHLDDGTVEAEENVQRDLLSWQGVQAGQPRVLSSNLQQLKTALLCGWQEGGLTGNGNQNDYGVKYWKTKHRAQLSHRVSTSWRSERRTWPAGRCTGSCSEAHAPSCHADAKHLGIAASAR